MRRWQESGVVEDSEDEEFDLSDTIVSPEPQPNRRKLFPTVDNDEAVKTPTQAVAIEQPNPQDGEDHRAATNDLSEAEIPEVVVGIPQPRRRPGFLFKRNANLYDDYDDWMTTNNVTTYGKISPKLSRPGTRHSNIPEHSGTAAIRPEYDSSKVDTTATIADVMDSRLQQDEQETLSKLRDHCQVASDHPDLGRDSAPRNGLGLEDDFPNIDEPLPSDVTFGRVVVDVDDNSSGLSSPLSERALSPVFFPNVRGPDSDQPGHGPRLQSPKNVTGEIAYSHADYARANAHGNRTFRARKEKQLHPYLFDKAQYEQQWLSRGLKPVNFRIPEKPVHETQDDSFSEEPSQNREHAPAFTSSPPVPSQPLPFAVAGDLASDDDLPDIRPPLPSSRLTAAVSGTHKRRKLGHLKQPNRPSDTSRNIRVEVVIPPLGTDEFAIPPSPPLTSSDSARTSTRKPTAKGFRLPGQTATHLPTPQISSATRPHATDNTHDLDSDESPRAGARLRNTPSRSTQVHVIESSDSLSASEHDSEVERRRLRRERKRIRGVLPASWLKIDLRAQRREPSPSHPSATARVPGPSPEHSPTKSAPAKGLAKRLGPKQSSTVRVHQRIELSDEDNTSELSSEEESRALRQTKIDAHTHLLNTADFDDERMETDWIDPMLASHSRERFTTQSKKKKRQPRITEAFDGGRVDFSEERRGQRNHGNSTQNKANKPSKTKRPHRVGRSRPNLPRLSIVDAARSVRTKSQRPQFVKLAQRTARQRDDFGRHSPSHKWIRLATETETLDANSTLRAWRAGAIAPVQPTESQDLAGADPDGATAATALTVDDEALPRHAAAEKENRNAFEVLQSSRPKQRVRINRGYLTGAQSRIPNDDLQQTHHPNGPSGAKKETRSRQPHLQRRPIRYTGAQLEKLETSFDRDHRAAAFERRINGLSENVPRRAGPSGITQAPQLQRYLNGISGSQSSHTEQVDESVHQEIVHARSQPKANGRARKRPAQRVEVDTREYRQPSEPIPEPIDSVEAVSDIGQAATLQGLGAFGTRYAIDFDVRPLPLGMFFQQSTFIGSGDFASSLQLRNRNFDVPSGRIRIHIEETIAELGVWTEDVASVIARIPHVMLANLTIDHAGDQAQQCAILQANMDHMLRSIVRYCSNCLSFLDPVDRRDCVNSLQRLVEGTLDNLPTTGMQTDTLRVLCHQYALVIAKQILQICDHELISVDVRERAVALFNRGAVGLARTVLPARFSEVRNFYEAIRQTSRREAGVRCDDLAITSLVILNHCLYDAAPQEPSFWDVVNSAIQPQTLNLHSVVTFDRVWYDVFSIVPVLEIDTEGIARVGTRYIKSQDNWTLVRQLVDQLLNLYSSTAAVNGSTLNDYVRAVLARCHRLVSTWGWWKAESVLGLIYDFFARRGLEQLEHEDTKGVPSFLENLEYAPSFEIEAGDRSFVIFLKTLATSLLNLRKHGLYSDRKIGGIAYRFIPNHGRTHRKDMDIKKTELDALRNHLDLLSTLYYATPPGHRPGIYLLRTVAEIPNSHREVCRHCVRSWTSLLSFQASTPEPLENLSSLTEWGHEMLQGFLSQYRLARTEAEQDFAATKSRGIIGITEAMLNTTIAGNQRQIIAMLVDALAGLRRALRGSQTRHVATVLIKALDFWSLFIPFKSSERRLIPALEMALDVTKTAFELHQKIDTSLAVISDESQDYGDSSALELFVEAEDPQPIVGDDIVSILHDPLGQLVSNVFGDDEAAEDGLLTKILHVWAQVAGLTVHKGRRTWMSYVDDYSPVAWNQLRETDQKRKFTPFFLSCVTSLAVDASKELKSTVTTSWLVSLVEREAALKYQHKLTEALLNSGWDNELVQNLPFIRSSRTKAYSITLQEIRQRRLAVISTVLSNLQGYFEDAVHNQPRQVLELRKTYQSMLQKLMQAMKANYSELAGAQNDRADGNVHGAYVEFVQEVVTYLQQYTTDICRVDTFFTDSSAFPLPVKDPAYVVGRLRSYIPKLAESKTRKQLATFVHTVSERAALEGQQAYLVDQLGSAVVGTVERGSHSTPSLRHVLMTAIFPAYVGNALDARCSWILAVPILRAVDRILSTLQYDMKMDESSSVAVTMEIMTCTLDSFIQPLQAIKASPELLQRPSTLQILQCVFLAVKSSVTVANYLERARASATKPLMRRLSILKRVAQSLLGWLESQDEAIEVDLDDAVNDGPWADTRLFAVKQTSDSITNSWACVEERVFVRRGNTSKEVVIELGDEEEEIRKLRVTCTAFCRCYETIVNGRPAARSEELWQSIADIEI